MELPRRALVVGATGGLGAALCAELEGRGVEVLRWSRSSTGLDLTDEGSIARAAAALEGQTLDWVIVATGMLAEEGHQPERRFAELDPARMARNYAVNAIGPALLIKHLQPRLPRDRPAAVAALSARLGSIGDNGLGGWMSYRAAKAGLNQLLRCASVELRRKRPQAIVVGLHPGTVDTPLTRRFHRGRTTATAAESARQLVNVVLGLGPEDSGGVFDYAGLPVPF
jgi:NAD(P)-dependent dehydrogenase (short-subunit alcohol dehydrogenase family)